MAAMAVNPTAPTYPSRSPYVSVWEFKNAPTGVDTSQLVPGGTAPQQTAALVLQLSRASAAADNICQKVLAATVDTQFGHYRVRHDTWLGPVLNVPLDYVPIVGVSAVSVGWMPNSLTALTDLSNVAIRKKTALIPFAPPGVSSGPVVTGFADRAWAQVQYVNGWANTALTAAPSGANISVSNPLGIVPGQQLVLANSTQSETVTVAATWVPTATVGTATVPLASAPVGSYASGDTCTALPQDIKQAVILIAKALIKTQASQSYTIPVLGGEPGQPTTLGPGVSSDYDAAIDLLAPYRRAV